MIIYVATINHNHGTDTFAAYDEKGILRKIAKFCENWAFDSDIDLSKCVDDSEKIIEYFKNSEEEYYDYSSYEVKTPIDKLEEIYDKYEAHGSIKWFWDAGFTSFHNDGVKEKPVCSSSSLEEVINKLHKYVVERQKEIDDGKHDSSLSK